METAAANGGHATQVGSDGAGSVSVAGTSSDFDPVICDATLPVQGAKRRRLASAVHEVEEIVSDDVVGATVGTGSRAAAVAAAASAAAAADRRVAEEQMRGIGNPATASRMAARARRREAMDQQELEGRK